MHESQKHARGKKATQGKCVSGYPIHMMYKLGLMWLLTGKERKLTYTLFSVVDTQECIINVKVC